MFLFFAFLFGIIIGSFLGVVTTRLPQGKSLSGRSVCIYCNRQLVFFDLIPVGSFMFLGGKCRGCKKTIPRRDLYIELFTGAAFLALAALADFSTSVGIVHFLLNCVIASVVIVTFIVDFEHYIILDAVTSAGTILVLLLLLLLDIGIGTNPFVYGSLFINGFIGAVAAPLPFYLLWFFSKGKWIGFGDVKFMIFMGAALGFPLVFIGMLFSFWAGAIAAIPLLLFGYKKLGSKIPFGCFLAIGLILALLYGRPLLEWYGGLVRGL